MNKYQAVFFENGRIALINNDDYDEAVLQGKEILVICNGWAGGYACAMGADKISDNEYDCYSYSVKNEEFTTEQLQKFYKVIITDGIRVWMKSGEQADFNTGNHFQDCRTTVESYQFTNNKVISREELRKLCTEIDIAVTKRNILSSEDGKEKWDCIKGYLCFEEEEQ